MKTRLLLFLLFSMAMSICFGQIQPIDHTAPGADNLKSASIKINANDTYLEAEIDTVDTRLDSLITAGVGSSLTASNGLTIVNDNIQIGGSLNEGTTAINTAGNAFHIDYVTGSGSGLDGHLRYDPFAEATLMFRDPDVPSSDIGFRWVAFDNSIEVQVPTGSGGLKYVGTPTLVDASLINLGLANSNYWKSTGETLLPNGTTSINIGTEPTNILHIGETTNFVAGASFATDGVIIQADQGGGSYSGIYINTLGVYLQGLPTTNPCATAGTNAIWNDAGTLKICP